MKIAVSGKCSKDQSDTVVEASDAVRRIVEDARVEEVETNLSYLVFFPVVLSDELGIDNKSHRSYSRKERSEFANVEIDVNAWSAASRTKQLQLMMAALKDAIRSTPNTRINEEAKDTITMRLQSSLEANVG